MRYVKGLKYKSRRKNNPQHQLTIMSTSINTDDIHSETSTYVVKGKSGYEFNLVRLETNEKLGFSDSIFKTMTFSATGYEKEENIGLEDKNWTKLQLEKEFPEPTHETPKVKDLKQKGIRKRMSEVPLNDVFCVEFLKVDTKENQDKKIDAFLSTLDTCTTIAAKRKCVRQYFDCGKDDVFHCKRRLVGKKIEMKSTCGMYPVTDLELLAAETDPSDPKSRSKCTRQVDVNSVTSLVHKNVKYNVQKK